jgi:hypothetical protein
LHEGARCPMAESPGDQRKFSRIPAHCAVLIRFQGGIEPQRFGSTRVVGMGGCCFLHPHAIAPDTRLRLDIAVGDKVVEAEARVAYSRPSEGHLFEVGVEFVDLNEHDRALLSSVFARNPEVP